MFFYTSVSNFNVRPLIYDQNSSRFPPKTPVLTIVKELMIEQWNPLPTYDLYWQACAPTYCTYRQTVHTKTFVEIVVTIVSMLGGLIVILRMITPRIVNFLFYLFRPRVRRQQQGNY